MSQFYQQLATLTPEQRALFEKKLAEKGLQSSKFNSQNSPILPRSQAHQPIPLSFAQQRLWFMQQLDADSTAYNVASVLKLQGTLEIAALEKSLSAIVERHETFRTHFELHVNAAGENQPIQVIEPPMPVSFKVTDLRSAADPQAAAEEQIKAITQTPFNLAQPLLRTALLRITDDSHYLVLSTHHIISDRWSIGVFLREMTLLYRAFCQSSQGQLSLLPPLPIQYADWAIWQRQQLQGETLQQQIDYWTAQLGGELPVLDLPLDRPYDALVTHRGSQVPLALPLELSQQLKAVSSNSQVTLFTLLLTAVKVLLHRYTGSDDIVVGSDIANRDRVETEGLIGLLVNTLVFRSDLSHNPRFCNLLLQVRETVLSGFAHQDLPFEKLVEVINPERHLSQMMPLFQVKLDLQQADVKPMQLEGLTLERYPLPDSQAKYELRFNLQDTPQGITGQIEYNGDLFNESTIVRMAQHFQQLLVSIVSDSKQLLSELSLLSAQEQTLLTEWNQTQRHYPTERCIHQLFETQVQKTPHAIAVTDGHTAFTYAELNAQANQLAHCLLAHQSIKNAGKNAGKNVGICMVRSSQMVVALLAVLKAGGTYVPLDPAYPAERLALIVEDAEISLLLTQGGEVDFLTNESLTIIDIDDAPKALPTDNLDDLSDPNQLAYIIYTSGSTGCPKGVAIPHRSAVSLLHWAREQFSAAELSGVLASTSICFDLSVFEIFVPLSWGGSAIVVENLLALHSLSEAVDISLINTVPSVLTQCLNMGPLPHSVQTVNLAGEALPVSLVQQLQKLSHLQKIYNLYGPSEDTTYSTCAPLHDDSLSAARVPIGKPIANTQAYVLDRYQQPVPIGIAGELYLGGSGLAQGYFNRPALTAECFVAVASLPDVPRLYKTGDRVRYLPDGSLEFLGRFDHQVKIRGFRIETGEIETALCQHPAVQEAIVSACGEGDKQLVAYVVPHAAALDSANIESANNIGSLKASLRATLRQHLAQQLPAYLIPTLWVVLEAFPHLPNGKIDRRALPQPEAHSNIAYAAPRSEVEKTLVDIWQAVLKQQKVGINDNFFELGGHSLLAIQIVAQAEATLQCQVPLKTIFQAPTIAALAEHVERTRQTLPSGNQLGTPQRRQIQPDPAQRNQPFPLTDIQQAYWLGRTQAFELGNIGTHGYREIDVRGLPVKQAVEQVEAALNTLIERHDMLRAVVNTDGQQQILRQVPRYKISVTDLRMGAADSSASLAQANEPMTAQLVNLRDRLSHQIFTPEKWPLFHIEAAQIRDRTIRFFVSFDVLIGDAWSFQQLGQEMARLTQGDALPTLSLSFRDYVIAEQQFRQTPAYAQALSYWRERLTALPPAPQLPLTIAPSEIKSPRFERRNGRLAVQTWQRLKQRAYQASLTPSGVVLAAFAEVLTTWSQQPQFTLNLTLFNRPPLHPEVNQIVGDFTASLLLAVDTSGQGTFLGRAQRLQNQLWEDLENRAVSGVQVLRELAQLPDKKGGGTSALMPVVFTSTLNQSIPQPQTRDWHTEHVFSVSQTSQVYLDHQVSDIAGELVFNWDAIADLFPADLLDSMFAAYSQLLHQLAEDEQLWQTLPMLAPMDHVMALNQGTLKQVSLKQPEASLEEATLTQDSPLLHELFLQQAKQQPAHLAIITPDKALSYRELAVRSQAVARQLRQLAVRPNQLVAVSMEKGWQQVVAVLGILRAGAAYVPIDPALPQERRWHLIADTAAEIVLITADKSSLDWPMGITQICVSDHPLSEPSDDSTAFALERLQAPSDLAYVIYTSGSTGTPKGVMIDHQGAVNTLLDINQRFEVSPRDRVFALSSLSFDLSVYDIFGTLAAGATLVMPTAAQEKNPAHWRSLLAEHKVTLWNSVPALMQLLTVELSSANLSDKNLSNTNLSNANLASADLATESSQYALRLVLLSGDWIALTLPNQIKQHFSSAQVVSLGGATEASIWSIVYPIESVDPAWRSIPYGRPLANQQWYVLDENLKPRPPWVVGQLYIGGAGLAKGYWNQPELTAERFVSVEGAAFSTVDSQPDSDGSSATCQTLYKTGDLGRYLPDETLEFLGREDFQVKINGYRVELGEIESALQQYPAIQSAVVERVGTPAELMAYVVPRLNSQASNVGDTHVLSAPLAKLEFKQKQLGIRAIDDLKEIALPLDNSSVQPLIRRQSHRQFLSQPIALETLSHLLAELRSQTIPNAPLPKYRYASAGSLYPIQTYLHIQANRVTGLLPGWYYYHPGEHRLGKIDAREMPDSTLPDLDRTNLYGPNQSLQHNSAFTLFLVANMSAIEPIYGDRARDFCLIETGYIGQLLMEQAPDLNLGLCPIGGFNSSALSPLLGLSERHQPLHALVGGAIDPSWNQQWRAVEPAQSITMPNAITPNAITDSLRQYLSEKLPRYMVPNRYHILESLPLTANGKVDRRSLPTPRLGAATEYVAPNTPTEKAITQLWQALLGLEKVGIADNFFEVGGNSLTAMQLLSQLQNAFQIEMTIAQLFGALTPAQQAQLIDTSLKANCQQTTDNTGSQLPAIPRRQTDSFGLSELSDEDVNEMLQQLISAESTSAESTSAGSQEVSS